MSRDIAQRLEQAERDSYRCRVYRQQIRQMQLTIERLKGQTNKLQIDLDAVGTAKFSDERFDKMRWRERALRAEERLAEAEHLITEFIDEEDEIEEVGTSDRFAVSRVP